MATPIFTLLVEANEKQYITPAEFVAICCTGRIDETFNPEELLRYWYYGDAKELIGVLSNYSNSNINERLFNNPMSFKKSIQHRLF